MFKFLKKKVREAVERFSKKAEREAEVIEEEVEEKFEEKPEFEKVEESKVTEKFRRDKEEQITKRIEKPEVFGQELAEKKEKEPEKEIIKEEKVEEKVEAKLPEGTTMVELTQEEKNIVNAHQTLMERHRMSLSNLRMQYLGSERQIIDNIGKAQADFVAHLKMLSQTKGIPEGEEWVFDPNDLKFKKREQK